jgi:hypothetical protein
MLIALLLGTALALPSPVCAAPPQSLVDQQAEAQAKLEALREQLASQMDDYVMVGTEIDRARLEVLDATQQLSKVDERLAALETALTSRAIELYRGDRISMIDVLFGAASLQDLFDRASYLSVISRRDARLVTDVRIAHNESMWLQQSLQTKMTRLQDLQAKIEVQRTKIEKDLKEQEAEAARIGADLAAMMRQSYTSGETSAGASAGNFNPDFVVSESTFRDSTALDVAQIQAFLESQPGALKNYTGKDHAGKTATAAQMIADASARYNINPKVLLTTLQKEQSLISRPRPSRRALDWAMGCGKTDSRTISKYRGFGKQIWYGAASLDKNSRPWHEGISRTIDGSVIHPVNAGTYALYKYTPHFRGNMSFWMLYWRYFGNPLA